MLYNEGSYSCSCVDCSYYSSAYKGKSTDGTINTCESKCKHTVEECKAKGLVLTNPGSESCACKKCSEINAAYSGDSTDGTVGGCQQASCKLTKSDCAQKGQVLLYPESYSCKCVDCSYYSSYKGKSKDGTFETCDKNTCEKTAAECGAKGLVLKNASSPNCECVSCSAINKAYTGTSSTGYESDCGGAKCELTVDKCKAQGLVLVNQYSKDCKCVSCDTNTNYKGKSKTGTYQGCDPVTCEKTAAACGAKGLVLKYPASVNCECVSCSDYDSRYQGTSSSGYIQDCEKKPEQKCQLTEAKCAESGKALINGYSPNCYCAGCEVCASWLAGATSKEGTCASCDWCDRP